MSHDSHASPASAATSSADVGPHETEPVVEGRAIAEPHVALEERLLAIENALAALRSQRPDAGNQQPVGESWASKHVGAIIGAVVTVITGFAASYVSYKQVELQKAQNQATLAQEATQAQARLQEDSVASFRDWNLRFASFLAEHQSEIFSTDSLKRARMREILFVVTPRERLTGLLDRVLIAAKQPAVQRDWAQARVDAEIFSRELVPVTVSIMQPDLPSGLLDSGVKIDETVDVWYAPWALKAQRAAARPFGRGTLYISGFIPAGQWAFWLQAPGSRTLQSDTVRLDIVETPPDYPKGFPPNHPELIMRRFRNDWPARPSPATSSPPR